jgi:hypothetical protein
MDGCIYKKLIGGNDDRCRLTLQRTTKFFANIAPLASTLYKTLPRRGISCLTFREVQNPEKLPGLAVAVGNFGLDWDESPF